MATLRIDNGQIVFGDCYEQRGIIAALGGKWDGKDWRLVFTSATFDKVLSAVKPLALPPGIEDLVREQVAKEKRLDALAEMAKTDAPVSLRIEGLKGQLRNYQKLGVAYALANGNGLLLADHMGLGKSIQAIATALALKSQGQAKQVLVITPASLKFNWPLEIEKFTDERWTVVDGAPDERIAQWLSDAFFIITNYELIVEDLFGGRKFKFDEDEDPAIAARKRNIKANAEKRRMILTGVRERVWDVIIADECHYVKAHRATRSRALKALKARFRMALTGTPMDGRLEELHSVMGFVSPGLFNAKKRFLERYAEMDYWGRIVGYKRMSEVRQTIKPFFLRRLKEDVLKDLPDKVYANKVITLLPAERAIYDALADQGHKATEDEQAIVAVIRCKQFLDYPPFVDGSCKTTSKLDAFRDTIDEIVTLNGRKVLVFSQYKTMVDVLAREMDAAGIKFLRIDGDTPLKVRADYQAIFNEDKTVDAMLGTSAMAAGLNFTAADHVILYDEWWSPSMNAQAIDRCHRIGQKNVVTVVRFICQGTIEERIRAVLASKNIVTSATIGDTLDRASLAIMGAKELAKLL